MYSVKLLGVRYRKGHLDVGKAVLIFFNDQGWESDTKTSAQPGLRLGSGKAQVKAATDQGGRRERKHSKSIFTFVSGNFVFSQDTFCMLI